MESNTTSTVVINATGAGLGSIFSGLVMNSIVAMIPWLTAMAAIVICDLISGVSWRVKSGIKVRLSKAVRDTSWKLSVYFFCVVAFCIIDEATGSQYELNKWLCLLFCAIEACSIIANVMHMHGYDINFNKVLGIFLQKKFDVSMEDSDGIIVKQGRKK